MNLSLLYVMVALLLGTCLVQRSKLLTIIVYLFSWTLMWTKYTADYGNYQDIYYMGLEFRDGGYKLLCSIGQLMGLSFFEFFMSLGFIAVALNCWFVLRYAQRNSLVAGMWMMFLSMLDFVQFRSFLAFSVVLCFIPLLMRPTRNRQLVYCGGVILASTIHLTMAFYLIFVFMNKEWFSPRNLKKIIVPLLLIIVAFVFGADYYMGRAETMAGLYNRQTSDLTKWLVALLLLGNVFFINLWRRAVPSQSLTEPQAELATPAGNAISLMNLSLLLLIPVSFQSLTVLRLYKYMAVVNFAYISNRMAGTFNWKLLPQTLIQLFYGGSYFVLFLVINGPFYIKGVLKPILNTNCFWPIVQGWFG